MKTTGPDKMGEAADNNHRSGGKKWIKKFQWTLLEKELITRGRRMVMLGQAQNRIGMNIKTLLCNNRINIDHNGCMRRGVG